MKQIALALAATLTLSACATDAGESRVRGIEKYAEDPRLGEITNEICFASNIDGFSMNDRDTVLLHEGRDRFMVEVTAGCQELEYASAIAVDSSSSCMTRGDSIIVSQALGGTFSPQRCMVRQIREWNRDAEMPEDSSEETAEENPA